MEPAQDWHPADIKASVEKTGTTLAALARRHGYGSNYLSQTLVQPMPNGERIIADHLNVKPSTIWPSRYDADGQPLRGRLLRNRYNTGIVAPRQRLKRVAS